jgi:Papain-like cysteine protease AvrRpt2
MPDEPAETTEGSAATGTAAATTTAAPAASHTPAAAANQQAQEPLPKLLHQGMEDPSEGTKDPKDHTKDAPRWITYLQQMLNYIYQMQVVMEHGKFDDITANAVRHFREQNHLDPGEHVDIEFWKKLGVEDAPAHGAGAGAGAGAQQGGGQHGDGSFQDVDGYSVTLVQKTTEESRWAAALATVANLRGDGLTVESLCQRANTTEYEQIDVQRAQGVGADLGLRVVACNGATAQVLAETLYSYGPLWTPIPGDDYHQIVLAGIKANGGHPTVWVFDPATGGDSWMALTDLASHYGINESYQANLLAAS